jgi:GT2 family glycosyltransferase
VAIIEAHADRLAWWVSEPDGGQADAINKGMSHARGEIVAWLNSDDYYLPGAVSAAVAALRAHPDAVFVYADIQAMDGNGRIINKHNYPQVSLQDLLCFAIIGQPAVFMRRTAFEAAGGLDTRFHLLLDHQLWIRLAVLGEPRHVNQTWAAARYHAAAKNISRAALFGAEAFKILEWAAAEPTVAPVFRTIRPLAEASAHRVNARYLLDAGKPGQSLREWVKALVIHPRAALGRLNILFGAIMELAGLRTLRRTMLEARARRLNG